MHGKNLVICEGFELLIFMICQLLWGRACGHCLAICVDTTQSD